MKLQNLIIIFIIIIIPIAFILSRYINFRIDTEMTELKYNTKLLNSTHDSIKAFQLNTVNNAFGDVTNSKISDIEGAVTAFYNSLANNFSFTGYKASVMKEYIPAVAFTLYDGYYIYSPFKNTLTGVKDDDIDTEYSERDQITNGLKPYVYYSARYNYNGSDFVINYTLDNYITIMGTINGKHVYDFGYLYPVDKDYGIIKNGDTYTFDGVEFKPGDTEELKEYVGNSEYSYVKINGKKYYLEEDNATKEFRTYNGKEVNINARFFFIENNGAKNYSQAKFDNSKPVDYEKNKEFCQYYVAIKYNKSAYMYYKKAYEFSKAVLSGGPLDNYLDKAMNIHDYGYGLNGLQSSNAIFYNKDTEALKESGITPLNEYGNYTIFDNSEKIHSANSNFNKHRKSIIRYVVETNMSTAISGYSSSLINPRQSSSSGSIINNSYKEFTMPKISETDWEAIENNVCIISFLQGLNLGSKKYNGYSVVANNLTKEYIDEDDIYIIKNDNTYCRVNDNTLNDSNISQKTGSNNYYHGLWKIDFERKKNSLDELKEDDPQYYYPVVSGIFGSYTSIVGSSGVNEVGTTDCPDMYAYISNKSPYLKQVYYKSLGRERQGSYNVNNVNYEIYLTNGDKAFLDDY